MKRKEYKIVGKNGLKQALKITRLSLNLNRIFGSVPYTPIWASYLIYIRQNSFTNITSAKKINKKEKNKLDYNKEAC